VKRTEKVPAQQSVARHTGRKLDFVIIAVLALAIALLVLDRFHSPRSGGTTSNEKSIAVLPFANLSEDKANAYFADGIQDEILTRLSKIGAMKVISRTSTQQFQSKPGSVTDIAKQLAVAHILEGSVQRAGDSVRVNVQLIKANHDSHVWAETYDRKLTDIFAVESEVAEKIASSLAAHLTGEERQAIANVPTQSAEAYDNYLRGITLLNKQGSGELRRAREALQRAIELDPNFAHAWARLALTESEIYFGGAPGDRDQTPAQLERARHAAETAMHLQANLSDSHLGLGSFYYYCLRDFDRALVELNEAHRLAPNDAFVIFASGLVKRRQGKLHEAIKLQEEAVVLDPRNSDMWVNLGRSYGAQRNFTHARQMYDRAIAIAPDEPDIVAEKADTFLTEGNLDAAEALVANAEGSVLDGAFGAHISLAVLRRNFERAIELLNRSVTAPETPRATRAADRIELGALQFAIGDPAGRANVEQGRAELIEIRNEGDTAPENAGARMMSAALLGDRAELDREAEALLRTNEMDHWALPRAQLACAQAYAMLGDAGRAVTILAAALAAPTDITPTPALLRINPIWDKIRDDPGFQKLCATGKL
jgi:TolB-like protein